MRVAHNGVWQPPLRFIRYEIDTVLYCCPWSNPHRNRTSPWEEKPVGKDNGLRLWSWPTFPSDSPTSVRCGRNSLAWANATDVLKVKVGDTLEFAAIHADPSYWDQPNEVQWNDCPEGRGICVPIMPGVCSLSALGVVLGFCNGLTVLTKGKKQFYGIAHFGPVVLHLSRVPAGQDVRTYDGSGEWLKVRTYGLEPFNDTWGNSNWLPYNGARVRH